MLKERILESSFGYAVWSAPVKQAKVDAIKKMLQKCGIGENKVLDIGCGPGTNAEMFEGWDYLGVDLNPQYTEKAKIKFQGKRFICGDATRLELDGEKFPVILINSLMHHLNDQECAQLLEGIKPLLTEKGSVIVQEPLTPAPNQHLMRFLMKHDRGAYFRPLNEWQSLFEKCGLKIASDDFYVLKMAGITGWQMYSVLLEPDR
ncbi:MAG: class I SAM-dependent methyltransferase [Blastocatellia bacterium]|nr:class I SAM-dependent methyltransferase [Blastocatellia bacterium]